MPLFWAPPCFRRFLEYCCVQITATLSEKGLKPELLLPPDTFSHLLLKEGKNSIEEREATFKRATTTQSYTVLYAFKATTYLSGVLGVDDDTVVW